MQTIETKVKIGDDRTISMQLPADVPVGEYEVVVVLNHRSGLESMPESQKYGTQSSGADSIQKIQDFLSQSLTPNHSLVEELIQERRKEAENE